MGFIEDLLYPVSGQKSLLELLSGEVMLLTLWECHPPVLNILFSISLEQSLVNFWSIFVEFSIIWRMYVRTYCRIPQLGRYVFDVVNSQQYDDILDCTLWLVGQNMHDTTRFSFAWATCSMLQARVPSGSLGNLFNSWKSPILHTSMTYFLDLS